MQINSYFYSVGKNKLEDRVGLLKDRSKYFTTQYIKLFKQELQSIKCEGSTAFLYAAGTSMHQGEGRNYLGDKKYSVSLEKSTMAIKETTAYMMHKYVGLLKDNNAITYANINSNTCASSMHSIYEAQELINSGRVDNVIIVAEERTAFNTLRIFDEMQIGVKVGEGFACIVLSAGDDITDAKWEYHYDNNPFKVTQEGYKKVDTRADIVKGHATGTEQNTEAEKVLGTIIGYKDKIGHTQGASALIELCMVLDDPSMTGSILCTASGLGGFYGSCVVHKDV